MELRRALDQLEQVHAQVARSEVFAGYRARTVGLTGALALAGALLWPMVIEVFVDATGLATGPVGTWLGFTAWWGFLAVLSIGFAGLDLRRQWNLWTPMERRRRRFVMMQFVPALLVGAALPLIFAHLDWQATEVRLLPLLPGIWAVCNGMGILASRPYMPRAVGWAGLWYVAAGLMLLLLHNAELLPDATGMGVCFGVGQLGLAVILYYNLERGTGREEGLHG